MNRIAELRKGRGISQSELAKELGIAQNTLSQYENETRHPTVRIIKEIAKLFDVTTNYVLGYAEATPTASSNQNYTLNNVTKIMNLSTASRNVDDDVNLYLDLGWKILHIGVAAESSLDGGASSVIYTLGWYGDPDNARYIVTEPPGEDRVEYI